MDQNSESIRYAVANALYIFPEIPRDRHEILLTLVLKALGPPCVSSRSLSSWLFDNLADLNLDWDFIARTIIGECQLQGLVASFPVGTKVRWFAPKNNVCDRCSALDGKIFNVVAEDADGKNWETDVWLGKSRFRNPVPSGNWVAAGLQDFNCRGSWLRVSEKPPEVSQEFENYLNRLFDDAFPSLATKRSL